MHIESNTADFIFSWNHKQNERKLKTKKGKRNGKQECKNRMWEIILAGPNPQPKNAQVSLLRGGNSD